MAVIPTQPLFQAPPAPDRSDASLAFEKGHTSLIGSGSQLLRGFGGEILRGLGLEEMGQNWIGDAYARGILMGMDVNEIDEQMTGPRTMRDIEDWKGAVAWGVNSVAEQVPTLVGQFAPAVIVGALTRNPALTTATALGTIDFMNTSEVYSQLLMEAGESRPALSIGTGVAMTSLDALLPLRVINRMKKGANFASFFGRKLKNPDRKLRHTIAGALEAGALEGSTEYFQTVFENLALQYVKENDMMAEFSEEMMHEQEEAGARGALIGTLLGVPVSYMGVRRASKAKADWVTGIMEQQNAFANQPLLTFNPSVPSGSPSLEEFNAPITTAINDKILESQIEWQRGDPTTQARERTARIMRDNWEGLLNADMEATLDRGDKSLLSALIGAERKKMSQRMTLRAGTELAPYDEVQARRRDEVSPPTFEGTIPVEDLRDKTLRMGMAGITGIYPQEPGTGPDRTDAQGRPVPGGEISLAAAGKGAEIGWSETARKPMIKEDGSSEVGEKGKPRYSITYDNGEVILERETPEGFKEGTTSRLSPWVVIDKESGEIRERGTNQLQLKKKYAAAPLAGGQKVRPAERVARTKDVLSQTYEKRLSEERKLPPGVADKVRLRNREGEPSNDSFTIQNIWYTQGAKPGQLSAQAVENREKLPKDQRTRESFEKGKGKVQTVYHLKNDRTDADLHVILPKAWELIILRSAPQTLREFGTERITPAEEAYSDPLISVKEKEELYEYTEAGGFITDIKKRRANLREFEKLMEDEKYRDRFIVALANAQAIRGERVHQNVNKYSVSPKSVIDKFIEDSAKSREEMGMPYARALQEEREAFAQMSEEQKGIKLENIARERLIKQAETTREALSQEELDDYQIAVDRGVVPDISPVSLDAETREGLGLTAVRDPSQGLDLTETGEEAPRKQRYVWKQDPAFTKILKQYAEEQGTTVKKLTREDVEIVQKDLWPDGKPIGSTKISTKREPGTDETIKSQQAVAAGAITRRLGRVDKAAKELERAKVTEDLDKKAEAAGITVVRPEAYPKGVPIIDVRDLETDSVPSPATHTVKVSPEVAGKKGLNPKFFYLYEVSKWGEPRGYIKILGQHIKKEDVIEVEGIKEARRVPAVERFIKVDSPENINIFKRGKFAGVERLVDIPESIPGHETISAAWVDPESGAIVVQRETEAGLLATAPVSKITGPWERGKPDIPERFDPDFYRTYEIYITWENREEHALILEELKDRLLNISRSITEPTAPTGEFEKAKIREQLEYTSIVDLEKNKDFLSKNLDKNIKSGLISVQLVPSMVGRINKERRKEGLYALPIDTRFRVSRVMRETGKGPIGMHYIEEIKKRITPRAVRTRKGRGPLWKKAGEEVDVFQLGVDIPPVETVETNRIRISHMGYSREVPLTKATKAFVKKSGIPERIGLFTEYNTLVVDGPAKGTRLMASFNTNIKDDLVEMEQFFYEMFDPATHAFGRWGENKDIIASKRAQDLKAHEGVMAQVRFFDGGLMEGTIGKVREKAGTFELITTKEEWKRKLPIEMDILGYDVIQFDEPAISKEKVKPYEYGDVVGGEPTDMAITGHRYLPAVFKSEEIVEEAAPVTAEGKTRVEVIKSQPSPEGKRGAERYTIVVDGVAETNALGGDKWGVKQTVTFLNNLERGSPEGLEVVSMPNEIATEVSPTSAVAISAEGEATVTGRHPISFARTDFIAPPVDKRVLPGKVPIGWEPEPKGKGTVSTVYTDIAKNIEQHEKQTADRLKAIADAVDKINKPPVVEGEPTVVEDAVAPVALGMDWDTTRLITTREEALEVQAALRKSWEAFNETRKAERKSVVRHPLMEQIWPDGETTTYRLDVLNPPTAKEKKAATAPVTPAPPVQEPTELDQILSAEARLASGETAVDTGVTETEVDTDVTETDVTDVTDVTAPVVTDEQAQEFDKLTQETFEILGKEGEITQAEIKKIQADFKKFGLKTPTAAQIRSGEVELTPAVAGDLGVIDSIVKTSTKGKETVPLYIAKQTDTNDKVLTSEEVKNKTLRELPLNQKFHDGVGGQWQKMQQMGDHRTLLKFIEGRAPQLEFQVEVEGKKGTTKFGPGWMIDADASSTPSNLYLVSGVEGLFTGKKVSVQETFARFKKDQPPLIENFSVVPESIEKDGRGRITYNTGLTPKEFRDEVSKRTGKLALTRLEKMGIIRIVQNQQDVPNPPSGMGVKSVERDGQAWFITNNIKREEIGGVFAHDLGVHVGMVNIYGQKTVSHILSSARAMRDSSDDWRDSFGLAEKLFSFITQAPASISEAAREQWATYTPEEAQAFITEEAIGYYAQRVDPYAGRKKGITNDLWTMLVDLVRRQSARIKRWLGKAMSEEEIIAFIRGGIRGAHNRNMEQASIRKTENYSAILDSEKGMGLDQKAIDTANAVLNRFTSERALENVSLARAIKDKVVKFFYPLKPLSFSGMYKQGRSLTEGRMSEAEEEGQVILKAFENLPDADNLEVYNYLTNPGADPSLIKNKEYRDAAIKYKKFINDIGQKAVERGLIPSDQLINDAYLPRIFLMNLLSTKNPTSSPWGRKPSQMHWTKERMDMYKEMREMKGEITDVRYLIYKAYTVPTQDLILLDFLQGISTQVAFEEGKAPWVLPNQWLVFKVTDPRTGKIVTKRRTIAAIRREIEGFQAVANHADTTERVKKNIDTHIGELEAQVRKYYIKIGAPKNPTEAQVNEAVEKYHSKDYDTKNFRPLPNEDRFGGAKGLWIRKEIYDDILGNAEIAFGEVNPWNPFGSHTRMARWVSIFKLLKVPLNPPSAARNFITNSVNMQLLGGMPFASQPSRLRSAFRAHYKNIDDGPKFNGLTAYQIAKKYGISGTTLVSAEIRQLEDVFRGSEKEGIFSILHKFSTASKKIGKTGAQIYQMLEVMGKTALIQYYLEHKTDMLREVQNLPDNLGPDGKPIITLEYAAVMEANRVLFDYSEVSPIVRGLRSSFFGAPFITFQVKVLPELIKTAARHPLRFWPYVAFYASAQALFGSNPFEDDEWDQVIRLAPEWIRERGSGFIMPFRDENGRLQVADLSYFFPWSGITQTMSGLVKGEWGQAAREAGLVAPGWQLANALLSNRDTFTGREIINENDSSFDKGYDTLSYAWQMAMPNVLTRRGFVNMPSLLKAVARMDPDELEGKIFDATFSRENRYGEPKRDVTSAMLSLVGLNLTPIPSNARGVQIKRYLSKERGLKADITSIRTDKSLTKKQRDRQINHLRLKIDEAREERREFSQETAGVGAVLSD